MGNQTIYNSVKKTVKDADADNRVQTQENFKRTIGMMKAAVHGDLKTRVKLRLEDEMRRRIHDLTSHHHEHKKLVAFEH